MAAQTHGSLLVVNKGDRALGIIDPVAGKQVATVALDGITGHEVAASPDGKRAFVPIYGNSGVGGQGTDGRLIRVIDLARREITGTIDLGKGVRPHAAVFGPKDQLLYVTTEIENTLTIIDPFSLTVVRTVPTGQPESHMVALTQDGRRAYTSNVGPGTISLIDLQAGKVELIIPVSTKAQRIALSIDDRLVFTADQSQPRLAVIATATNAVVQWIELPAVGYGTAPTPDGRWLLVALPKIAKLGVVDLQQMKLARTLDLAPAPQEVLVRPDGKTAYVSCDRSGQVAVIDLTEWKVGSPIAAGTSADGLAWARLPATDPK